MLDRRSQVQGFGEVVVSAELVWVFLRKRGPASSAFGRADVCTGDRRKCQDLRRKPEIARYNRTTNLIQLQGSHAARRKIRSLDPRIGWGNKVWVSHKNVTGHEVLSTKQHKCWFEDVLAAFLRLKTQICD